MHFDFEILLFLNIFPFFYVAQKSFHRTFLKLICPVIWWTCFPHRRGLLQKVFHPFHASIKIFLCLLNFDGIVLAKFKRFQNTLFRTRVGTAWLTGKLQSFQNFPGWHRGVGFPLGRQEYWSGIKWIFSKMNQIKPPDEWN